MSNDRDVYKTRFRVRQRTPRGEMSVGGVRPTSVPVRLEDVSVIFTSAHGAQRTRVLNDISLTCAPGEFVVLIGPSGCGKTTVLNVLAGLVEVDRGVVEVLGMTPRAARPRLGYMLARDALLPWRTALRNVEFSLEIHGVARSERRAIAHRYLELLGLSHAEGLYPWQLSQGMRQRVALARTWASGPEVLLMDEPFSALDAQTRTSVRQEFLAVWERERRSVVFVTHDLDEAILLGDRVVLLNHGNIQLDATVPFSRPRNAFELQGDAEFVAFRRQLWDTLVIPSVASCREASAHRSAG